MLIRHKLTHLLLTLRAIRLRRAQSSAFKPHHTHKTTARNRPHSVARQAVKVAALAALIAAPLLLSSWLLPRVLGGSERPFRRQANLTLKGDLAVIGNTLQHCSGVITDSCEQGENNRRPQLHVDDDGTVGNSTFNSSRAKLAMPTGATVAWARLYWSATLDVNPNDNRGRVAAPCGDPTRSGNDCTQGLVLRDKVKFHFPGAADYVDVQGQLLEMHDTKLVYLSYADVTSLLANVVGTGALHEYRVANVQAALGIQRHASWSLVIAYSDPNATKIRNMIVYDGFKYLENDDNESDPDHEFTMSGFQTASPQPAAKLWVYSTQGDNHLMPDKLTIGGRTVGDSDNYFKGRITDVCGNDNDWDGLSACSNFPRTTRTPRFVRSVAADLQRHTVPSNAISAGDTSVRVRAELVGDDGRDAVYLHVFALTNELNTPNVTLTKSSSAAGNVPLNGDITYTITATNTGNAATTNFIITDPVPAYTEYKSGGQLEAPPNSSQRVKFNVDALAAGASTTVSFIVTAKECGTATNQATADFTAAGSGLACRVQSNSVSNTVGDCPVPQLDVFKESRYPNGPLLRAGDTIEYTVTVTNRGAGEARFVVLGDAIPASTTYVPGSLQIVENVDGEDLGNKNDCHIANCAVRDEAYLHDASTLPGTTFGRHLVFHIGKGATECYGGALATGQSTKIRFRVRVDDNTPVGTCIENGAGAFFQAPRYGFDFDPVGRAHCNMQPVPMPPPSGVTSSTFNSNVTYDCVVAPDLALTKTAPPAVCVGAPLTYVLEVLNNGRTPEPGVVVDDTLPENVIVQLPLPNGCSANGRAVTCNLGQMNSGETRRLNLTVIPQAAAVGTITNAACVRSQTGDSAPGNNCDTADTEVYPATDLGLTFNASTSTPCPDSTVTYTAIVTNNGPQALGDNTPATLTIGLPPQVTLPVVLPDRCTRDGNLIRCSIGALGAGARKQFAFAVSFPTAAVNQTLTSTASVTYQCDASAANNQVAVNVTPIFCADLTITLGDTPDPVIAGQDLTYKLTATNNGPNDAEDLTISDTFPPSLFIHLPKSPDYILATSVTLDGSTLVAVTWPGPTRPGAMRMVQVVATVYASVPDGTTISDTATVRSKTTDPNPNNNSATATTAVIARADLSVVKEGSPHPVIAGNNLTYTIKATNALGGSDAQDVVITDPVPEQTTFVSAMPSAGADCRLPAVGARGTVACTWRGATKPGEMRTLTLVVKVDPSAQENSKIINSVKVGSKTPDPNPPNNEPPPTETPVVWRADLLMAMSDTPDPVLAGSNITYTLSSTNRGPSNARNVTITDPLPPNARFVSATPSAGGLLTSTPPVGGGGIVAARWAGDTPVGATRTIIVVLRTCTDTSCNSTISYSAATSSDTVDPDPSNNSATEITAVQAQTDLSITKSGTPNPVRTGTRVTYTLDVTNNGPSNSINTIVTDTLPKGFTVASVSTPVGTFSIAGEATKVVTINLGTMGATGQCATTFPTSVRITVTADVPSTYPTLTVVNRATVTTGNCLADPNPGNNTADFSTSVVPTTNDPGPPIPAPPTPSDTLPGSVLVYNLYTSSVSNAAAENTRVNLTNTAQQNVAVHLFFVDGGTCSIADAVICLTKNQTASFLASDLDPGTTGYLVAVAVDETTGLPRAFNYLIGDAYVKLSSGHQANLTAESFAALMFPPAGVDTSAATAVLNFDGMSYSLAPRTLAVSNLPDRASGNDTRLILNRFGGNLAIGAATLGAIFGILYDDAENAYSFSFTSGACQFRSALSNNFPRTAPRFEQIIGAGRSGWLKLAAASEAGLLGAVLNFNPNAGTNAGAFNQGRNLHKLTLTGAVSLVIPVFPPSC